MAKERTEKSCYQSRFGSGWVSASQWLSENMCSRKSRKEFGGELPAKFWKDKYWEKQLLLQLKHANDLLKEFDVPEILAALKHPDAKNIYSLGLKNVLVPLIQKEKNKLLAQQKLAELAEKTIVETIDVTQSPRRPFGQNKTNLQRLRDLDG